MTTDLVLAIVPLLVGTLLIVLARPLAAAMVRYAEWQVMLMRRPGFVWYYRSFGVLFLVTGAIVFVQALQH